LKINIFSSIIINAIGSEQKKRVNREINVVLFGVPTSEVATEEERAKDDELHAKF